MHKAFLTVFRFQLFNKVYVASFAVITYLKIRNDNKRTDILLNVKQKVFSDFALSNNVSEVSIN